MESMDAEQLKLFACVVELASGKNSMFSKRIRDELRRREKSAQFPSGVTIRVNWGVRGNKETEE